MKWVILPLIAVSLLFTATGSAYEEPFDPTRFMDYCH